MKNQDFSLLDLILPLLFVLASVAALINLSACGNYRIDKVTGETAPILENPQATSVDFISLQSQLIGPKCLQCHDFYRDYDTVRREYASMLDSMQSGRMPKQGPRVSTSEIERFRIWASLGFPREAKPSDGAGGLDPIEPLRPESAIVFQRIIGPRCLTCHSPSGEVSFVDFSSRAKLFGLRNQMFGDDLDVPLLNFDKPGESYFLQILRDPVEPMPPRRPGLRPITDEEYSILREWIAQGMP
jgi:hypothetical protein